MTPTRRSVGRGRLWRWSVGGGAGRVRSWWAPTSLVRALGLTVILQWGLHNNIRAGCLVGGSAAPSPFCSGVHPMIVSHLC
jgi:hypothetical protein